MGGQRGGRGLELPSVTETRKRGDLRGASTWRIPARRSRRAIPAPERAGINLANLKSSQEQFAGDSRVTRSVRPCDESSHTVLVPVPMDG
jgi:hypothetical protein